jgi:hypothetical protein
MQRTASHFLCPCVQRLFPEKEKAPCASSSLCIVGDMRFCFVGYQVVHCLLWYFVHRALRKANRGDQQHKSGVHVSNNHAVPHAVLNSPDHRKTARQQTHLQDLTNLSRQCRGQ